MSKETTFRPGDLVEVNTGSANLGFVAPPELVLADAIRELTKEILALRQRIEAIEEMLA